jgi:aspartyl-tRNA(Asn)/glutamyl-tRNA(Gln) amidotransferase subunit C
MAAEVITRDQVLHVARLARLALDEDEVQLMTEQLGSILQYMHGLSELDTSAVHPTCQLSVESLPLRADIAHEGLSRDRVLGQSPRSAHDGFAVPAFLDE